MVKSSMLLFALLTVGACGRTAELMDGQPAPGQTVTITVTNQNPADVDVFAVRGSQRYRLGTVTTAQSQTFNLPSSVSNDGNLRLTIDPIGSTDTFTTSGILVTSGQHVKLDVLPNLRASVYTVD